MIQAPLPNVGTNGNDDRTVDRNICVPSRRARTVNNGATFDHHVVHSEPPCEVLR